MANSKREKITDNSAVQPDLQTQHALQVQAKEIARQVQEARKAQKELNSRKRVAALAAASTPEPPKKRLGATYYVKRYFTTWTW